MVRIIRRQRRCGQQAHQQGETQEKRADALWDWFGFHLCVYLLGNLDFGCVWSARSVPGWGVGSYGTKCPIGMVGLWRGTYLPLPAGRKSCTDISFVSIFHFNPSPAYVLRLLAQIEFIGILFFISFGKESKKR